MSRTHRDDQSLETRVEAPAVELEAAPLMPAELNTHAEAAAARQRAGPKMPVTAPTTRLIYGGGGDGPPLERAAAGGGSADLPDDDLARATGQPGSAVRPLAPPYTAPLPEDQTWSAARDDQPAFLPAVTDGADWISVREEAAVIDDHTPAWATADS
ncbi:MAG: hypothetical protein JWP01_1743 [Myxococcales bacterium]|nr:hypothetical protein [Myxococcales bacterium]